MNVRKVDSVATFSKLPIGSSASIGGAYGGLTEGRGISAATHITSIEFGSCILDQTLRHLTAIRVLVAKNWIDGEFRASHP